MLPAPRPAGPHADCPHGLGSRRTRRVAVAHGAMPRARAASPTLAGLPRCRRARRRRPRAHLQSASAPPPSTRRPTGPSRRRRSAPGIPIALAGARESASRRCCSVRTRARLPASRHPRVLHPPPAPGPCSFSTPPSGRPPCVAAAMISAPTSTRTRSISPMPSVAQLRVLRMTTTAPPACVRLSLAGSAAQVRRHQSREHPVAGDSTRACGRRADGRVISPRVDRGAASRTGGIGSCRLARRSR